MSAESSNAVEIRGLVKRFGAAVAVDHLDLDIRRGELLSLLGPNGAGKSTTLRIVTTLMPATEGSVVILGHRVPDDNARVRPLLGLVPQEIALYDVLSPRRNLRFFGWLYGMNGPVLEERINQLLRDIDLTERAEKPVGALSGGMQRRVNIAAALVHDPAVIFLDEPTVGLDPVSREAIWKLIEGLRTRGKTMVLTTHYMEEAEALSDRVAIVDHGKVIAVGTTAELIAAAGISTMFRLSVAKDPAGCVAPLQAMSGVKDVRVHDGRVQVYAESGGQMLPQMLQGLVSAGVEVRAVEVVAPNLGAVFQHYTGRELDEPQAA